MVRLEVKNIFKMLFGASTQYDVASKDISFFIYIIHALMHNNNWGFFTLFGCFYWQDNSINSRFFHFVSAKFVVGLHFGLYRDIMPNQINISPIIIKEWFGSQINIIIISQSEMKGKLDQIFSVLDKIHFGLRNLVEYVSQCITYLV